ncbi:MAG: starch synthase [Novosphingobium sp. 28-62-57]|uniref:glycogen synthase GlgA n=1 Tax=unclassified Novosphingobium TaxID=2644732 RepID=UPI000BD10197|nr:MULTISPECIES: glycogen synthase GlgA [unclassified Novosphingobium]OYW49992.1 MAG: starch synthase [Novosphingobium sp. 12-62-10]OYZ12146.1 MAG: starch synthase [Novosphingobium sp. 28-62-57]OZA39613.1 MAG: starch synthase [Novosphingobium sp. 17-62-9]
MTMKILSIASEAVPLIKTGGLADVAGALPAAVAPHGVEMTTILPGYPAVMKALARPRALHTWDSLLGEKARLVSGKIDGHPLLVVDAPAFFQRDGGPYVDGAGRDWADNWRRFAAFSRAAADVAGGAVKGRKFDLAHAHDWQAAMALAYLRFAPPEAGSRIPSVMTIHNMAFQGHYGADLFSALALPPQAFAMDGVEYHGGVGFLKAGLEAASAITTVSPTYAREIRTPEFGMGLEGLILSRHGHVHGIVNGIDTAQWNPEADPALKAKFGVKSLAKRDANKRALEAEFALEPGDGPIFVVISRLTWQKGIDVLLECIDHLVGIGGRLALLGSGDRAMENAFHAAAMRHPGKVAVRIGYDEALSHRMQAGGDAILVPSRFEPCGLTQLYGLAYGCVPVVARTGGLADTVIDANLAAVMGGVATGVQFDGVHYAALADAITRTVTLYWQRDTWRAIQRAAMKTDFSWNRSGKAYADLYASLIAETP